MSLAHAIANEQRDARAARRLARLLNPTPAFCAHLPGSARRAEVECYIAERFQVVHGATIHDFMPVLLTMGCHGGITAASGVRSAAGQPLFLEQYLGQPIEQTLANFTQGVVKRARIAEIGNLVATQGGSSYLLFMVLTAILEQAGFEWVVFTATPQVRKALHHLGLPVRSLCAADPGRLTRSSAADWGRYYASHPEVVAGRTADAMQVLGERMLYASALALFRTAISELADVIRGAGSGHGTHILTA